MAAQKVMWVVGRVNEWPVAVARTSDQAWSRAMTVTDCDYEELIEDGFSVSKVSMVPWKAGDKR
jgi:hypothetical protein